MNSRFFACAIIGISNLLVITSAFAGSSCSDAIRQVTEYVRQHGNYECPMQGYTWRVKEGIRMDGVSVGDTTSIFHSDQRDEVTRETADMDRVGPFVSAPSSTINCMTLYNVQAVCHDSARCAMGTDARTGAALSRYQVPSIDIAFPSREEAQGFLRLTQRLSVCFPNWR